MSARDELSRLLEQYESAKAARPYDHHLRMEARAKLIVWFFDRADRLLALWEAAEKEAKCHYPEKHGNFADCPMCAALAALEDTDKEER